MSLYVNNKQYISDIIIDKGLRNVDVTSADIRPGKISIDSYGNKLLSATDSEFLSKYTNDATATAADITAGKTLYNNGVKITGTSQTSIDIQYMINADKVTRAVAQNNVISVGDFVQFLTDNTVALYSPPLSTIRGIALQSGQYGDSIEIAIPRY